LAYNPDDGLIYAMASGELRRYTTAGVLDGTLASAPANVQGLTHVGGDQFLGIADDKLYQYDAVLDSWQELTTLSQSFPDAGLAFDFGALFAITSADNQLYKIDLTTYTIAVLGSRASSSGGGLSTSCKCYFFYLVFAHQIVVTKIFV
jgi:hypothetical protein